jgi:hypothetical protein
MNRRGTGSVVVALLFAVGGCNQGRPSVPTSTEEATVTGSVTVRGKPATKGEIVFDSSNYLRKENAVRTAPIQQDGSYTIKTFIGGNRVQVNAPGVVAGRAGTPADQSFEVKPGENRFDIELSPPTSAGAGRGRR